MSPGRASVPARGPQSARGQGTGGASDPTELRDHGAGRPRRGGQGPGTVADHVPRLHLLEETDRSPGRLARCQQTWGDSAAQRGPPVRAPAEVCGAGRAGAAAHSLSHRTLARRALSCRTVGHWFARMLLTPTRLRRMAVSTGSSKDSRSALQGAERVGRSPPHATRPGGSLRTGSSRTPPNANPLNRKPRFRRPQVPLHCVRGWAEPGGDAPTLPAAGPWPRPGGPAPPRPAHLLPQEAAMWRCRLS